MISFNIPIARFYTIILDRSFLQQHMSYVSARFWEPILAFIQGEATYNSILATAYLKTRERFCTTLFLGYSTW